MLEFAIRRLMQMGLALFAMSVLVFFGLYQVGDPVELLIRPDATLREIAETRTRLGLDGPVWEQYLRFLSNALQGDLGRSFVYARPPAEIILERLPATLELALVAMVLTVFVGLPLGLVAGLWPDTMADRGIVTATVLGFSLPSFWVGLALIFVFSVWLGWLPSSGRGQVVTVMGIRSSLWTLEGWSHAILPALNLALFNIALTIRLIREGTREALLSDHVRFARAKGLGWPRIIFVHVLKGVLIPVVTVLGMEFGGLIAFAVVTETVFAWPGMGKLIIDSINLLDRPVIVTYLLFIVLLVMFINAVVDLTYGLLDPRVRVRR